MLKSVDRALQLLQLISASELGTTEAARALQTDKAAVIRLTQTLCRAGFLARDPVSRRYRIGPELGRIALRYLRGLDVVPVLLPYMEELQRRTGETISLNVRNGAAGLCVAKVDSDHPLRIFSEVGNEFPLHCGSSGKSLLAGLPEREMTEFLDSKSPLRRYTDRTITDPALLRQEIGRVERQGYAVSREELHPGISSVGISLRDAKGYPVASISVVGPAARIEQSQETIIGHLEWMKDALREDPGATVAVEKLRVMPQSRRPPRR